MLTIFEMLTILSSFCLYIWLTYKTKHLIQMQNKKEQKQLQLYVVLKSFYYLLTENNIKILQK